MEQFEKYDIVKLMRGAEKGVSPGLKDLCDVARQDFRTISNKIHLKDGKKIAPVSKLIEDIALLRVCKPEDVQKAVSIFNEYIIPYLKEEERKKLKDSTGTFKKVNEDSRAPSVEYEKQNEKLSPKTAHTDNVKTPIPKGTDELAEAFRDLYQSGHREQLCQDITKHRNSKSLGIECIVQIVKKLFELCKEEAELHLRRAEECAKEIVETGKSDPQHINSSKLRQKSTDEIVRRYLYIHADLPTERLQKHILQEVINLLIKTYSIDLEGNSNLSTFTRKCADITWLICVEDPVIDMVDDTDARDFDDRLYDVEKGKPGNGIVWPALKFECSEDIFSKGIVWCK